MTGHMATGQTDPAEQIGAVLAAIDAGHLDATAAEVAYLRGVVDTLTLDRE